MSTSERGRGAPGPQAAPGDPAWWDAAFAAAGADAPLISRMMNELFRASPGAAPGGPPSAASASPDAPLAPPVVPGQALDPRPDGVPGAPSLPAPSSPIDPALLLFSPVVPPAAAASQPGDVESRPVPGALAAASGAPPPGVAAPVGPPRAEPSAAVASLSPARPSSVAAPPAPPAPPTAGADFRPVVTPAPEAPTASAAPPTTPGPPAVVPASPEAEPPASPGGSAAPAATSPAAPFDPFALSWAPIPLLGSAPPAAAGPPGGPSPGAVPGPSYYFLDEASAGVERRSAPPRLESLELGPGALPDLGIAHGPFDPHAVRSEFPVLQERVHGRPLVWLDNAATTQKPNAVIDRVSSFYRHEYSNIHRGAHGMAARATDAYEGARERVRRFLNAGSTREIVFVRGTTEGVNLVAQSWGRRNVAKDDEIVVTWLEHHANIVPWQLLCAEKGARLRVAPVDDRGQVILEEYEKLLGPRTRLVAVTHVSNALGTVVPVREMIASAHRHGARVLVDGAQAVAHFRPDVQALDCDWYVFSGHKVFAPSGIGVVFGKAEVLDGSPPWQGGGNMIEDVTFERTTYQPAPARFEAGTPSIADAVGLGAALEWFESVGVEAAAAYEHRLLEYATAGLLRVPGLRLVGTAREKVSVLSFVLDGFRPEDVGAALDKEGIAVRSGHHCAQPILRRFGLEATVRPSLALYNTCEDVDALVAALLRIQAGRGHRGL